MIAANMAINNESAFYFPWIFGESDEAKVINERWEEISTGLSNTISISGNGIIQGLQDIVDECSADNWDGYGAKAIDPDSYSEAQRFSRILPTTIPIPEITVEPDGEIAFEWYNGKRRVLSVSIGSHNELTYAGLFGKNKTHGVEDFGDELPKTILDNLQRVFA